MGDLPVGLLTNHKEGIMRHQAWVICHRTKDGTERFISKWCNDERMHIIDDDQTLRNGMTLDSDLAQAYIFDSHLSATSWIKNYVRGDVRSEVAPVEVHCYVKGETNA